MAASERSRASFDSKIGWLLRVGVLASAAVIALGGIWHIVLHWHDRAAYSQFHALTPDGVSQTVLRVGIIMLIATPVARVILSLFLFWRDRDYLYVAITGLVVVVLAISLWM